MSSLSSSSSSFSTPHSTFFSNNKEEGEIDSLSSSSSFHWTPFYPLEDRKTQPSSSFMTPSLHVLQTQTPMKSTNESPFLHLESSSTGSTPFGATSSPHPHRFSGTSSAILQQNLMQQDPFNLTSETTTPFSSCVSNETLQKPLPCPIPPSPSFSNLSTVAPPPPNPNPPLITPSTPLLNYSTPCVQPLTSTLNSKKDPLLFKPPPLGPSTPCPVAGDHTHRTASVRPLLASRLSTSSSMMGSFLPTCKVEFLKLLNVGGQGVIFLAQLVEDPHSWVVVKVFYKTPTDYELECLRKVSISTYCIRLIMETRVSKAMVLRYSEALHAEKVSIHSFTFDAEGYAMGYCYEHLYGDLERAILDRKRRIPNTLKCLIALQIAYFLKTVHRLGYIFRDLKPSNVLLNIPIFSGYTPISEDQVLQYYIHNKAVIKVTDFGLVTRENASRKTRGAGTVGYMPTSQMLTTTYDCSVDVTAYAITVAELFLDDLVFHYEEKDDEIKGMFLNSEVQARIGRRFERLSWIPKDIPHLIITALSDRTTQSLDTFIRYLQQYFKHLCFAKDLRVPEVGLALSEFRGGLR